MPPTETSKDIMNVIFTDRLSSNIYFFCKKKLITIPTVADTKLDTTGENKYLTNT